MDTKNIYCIVGPSGVGKTTVEQALVEKHHLKNVCSYTTRKPRGVSDKSHTFISDEGFDQLQNLCAYTMFCGHRYGVTAEMIDAANIYVIDIDGVDYLRKHYNGKPIKVITLTASEKTLRARMKKRGDSEEKINERIKNDKCAFADLDRVADCRVESKLKKMTVRKIWRFIQENEAAR